MISDGGWLFLLLGIGALALWFNAARAANEAARAFGRRACQAAGVQWLDESMQAHGLRFKRGDDGKLGVAWKFRYEYSRDGLDRHIGDLWIQDGQLLQMSGPLPPEPLTH